MRTVKVYEGRRDKDDAFVLVSYLDALSVRNERKLKHLIRHSPSGLEWGYEGSGPADLAFSLLIDHFGGGDIGLIKAEPIYQEFKRRVVARLPRTGWTMDTVYVDEMLRVIEAASAAPDGPGAIVELCGAR